MHLSRRWLAFAAIITASVMDLLDSTIAQVAAPSIRRDLGGSYTVIEWLSAAYALAMAVGLLTGGRLGDLYGRKRVLLAGMAGFIAASAACAAAATPGELIAARAAQGLAGAVMLPQVFGLISDLFEPHEMSRAFAVFSPVMGLSAMLGPIVSGGLIGLNLFGTGWRMIFLVNVPVGLAALAAGARFLPAVPARANGARGARGARLDLPGAALAAWRCSCWSSRWCRGTSWAGPAGCSACSARPRRCWPASGGIRSGASVPAAPR
jgi:MFS family permease